MTKTVKYMANLHQLDEAGTQCLGEAVLAAMLLASASKGGEKVNLNIRGSGWSQQVLVDAYPEGQVRGYLIENQAPSELPERVGPWGEGVLSVLRSRDFERKQPYIGTVPLVTGHLAKDLTFYWHQSEQVPSACGLSVRFEGGQLVSAGGFLVQALPGAGSDELRAVEARIQELQDLDGKFAPGANPLALVAEILGDRGFSVLEERPLYFHCGCTLERVARALVLMGENELRSMRDEDHGASIHCDFCSEHYRLDHAALSDLIDRARA